MLSAGEDLTYEAWWVASEVTHSQVEMGIDHHGLCDCIHGSDSVWVIVDRLIKPANFISVLVSFNKISRISCSTKGIKSGIALSHLFKKTIKLGTP
ncbi:MAG: hypothetical protein Q8883_02670, partial [Sweet potato little leaf phytoplasma]|nr:hypothetical protein [Sweet potato little leaf phytoplasma]